MTDLNLNVYEVDAAYKPFPSFAEWMAKVSVDTVRWDRYIAALTNQGNRSPEILARAINVATRAAALDTGAIEGLYDVDRGFTFTVAFETTAWETAIARKGEQVRPLFEAQLHAYDFVLDLATKAEQFSEAAVRQLHAEICSAQDTYRVVVGGKRFQEQALTKGRYKVQPNHVLTRDGVTHSYAPVDVTPVEMARLLDELRSDSFGAAHPVIQAAYAHYALVIIHPFADGNGRVARALASAFTYRKISMPIVILSEQKEIYLNSLEQADRGDYQCFVDFMLARALETIQMVNESLLPKGVAELDSGFAKLEGLYRTEGGYTQDEVDSAAAKLQAQLMEQFDQIFVGRRSSKLTLTVNMLNGGSAPALDSGYRYPAAGAQIVALNLSSAAPASAHISQWFCVAVPWNATGGDDVKAIFINRSDSFIAQVEQLIPQISGVVKIRAELFASRIVATLIDELTASAERALRGGA